MEQPSPNWIKVKKLASLFDCAPTCLTEKPPRRCFFLFFFFLFSSQFDLVGIVLYPVLYTAAPSAVKASASQPAPNRSAVLHRTMVDRGVASGPTSRQSFSGLVQGVRRVSREVSVFH